MEQFAVILEKWYESHGRDLPWRATADPYRIWVSEIILQQTRVAQGYEYFMRFMERFPTVQALAGAADDEVMKLWQGLGYYSRARNLLAAARDIVARGGTFPRTYEGVRALKGVGDYTAAAICAFAYGMPCAVVDGNVYRVLARWMGIGTPIDTSAGKKLFASLARELLDERHPALYNQAIMDFGALQCTPQSPGCASCPLAGTCVAFAEGRVTALPVKSHKTKVTVRHFNYLYVRSGSYTFIKKRDTDDIWRDLYELPLVESPRAWDEAELLASDRLRAWVDCPETMTVRCLRREVKHVLSHQVIYATFYELTFPEGALPAFEGFLRVPIADLERYAVPRLVHQFLEKFVFA